MKTIPSAAGEIDLDTLGFTLPHEHLFMRSPGVFEQWPHLWNREREIQNAVTALDEAHSLGVRTLIDLTTVDLGRDIEMVASVAQRSPVNVLVATGVWCEPPRYFVGNRVEKIADLFVRDIETGVAGTGVRAAVIKAGTRAEGNETNAAVLRACAQAQRRTGVPLMTHHDPEHWTGRWQQDIFESEGVDLAKVVIGHAGDSKDLTYLTSIMDRGSFAGMDRFGLGMHRTEEERASVVAALCRAGYADRMLLSHDASCFMDTLPPRRRAMFPNWNFGHLSTNVIPRLRELGVSDTEIVTMTVANPQRLLTP